MSSRFAFAVFLFCPFASGCGVFGLGASNLLNEARLIRDNRCEKLRYICLAHEAWHKIKASSPGRTYSVAYGEGFQAGFADYLYAGGCGEPPTLPPKRYRHIRAESPAGAVAVQQWYEGFRHGAAVANESGLRQFVVVSLPSPPIPQSPPPVALNAGPELAPSSPLPMPRRKSPETSGDGKELPAAPDPTGTSESSPDGDATLPEVGSEAEGSAKSDPEERP